MLFSSSALADLQHRFAINVLVTARTDCRTSINFHIVGCLCQISFCNYRLQGSEWFFVLLFPWRVASCWFHISDGNKAGVRRKGTCKPISHITIALGSRKVFILFPSYPLSLLFPGGGGIRISSPPQSTPLTTRCPPSQLHPPSQSLSKHCIEMSPYP